MASRGKALKRALAIALALAVLTVLAAVGHAGLAPGIAWDKDYDVQGNDCGWSMQQTTDGGYILAGTAGDDVGLAKVDAGGNMQWNDTYSFGDRAKGYSVRQASDGGYVVTGYVRNGSEDQILLMKADGTGAQLWNKTYGTAQSGGVEGAGTSVRQTADGGYLIAAQYLNPMTKNIGIYLIKTDAGGNMQNAQMVGKNGDITSPSLEQTIDGGHIIAATIHFKNNPDDYEIYLLRLDASGGTQWEKTIGGTGDQYGGHDGSVQQTLDGGFIIAGENGGAYLAKTDAAGNVQWSKVYSNSTKADSVRMTSDGGYVLGGTSSDGQALIIKTGPAGDELWRETAGTGDCEAMSTWPTSDGGYAAFGTDGDEFYLIKLNPPAPSPTPTPAPATDNSKLSGIGTGKSGSGLFSLFGNLFGHPSTGVDEGQTDSGYGLFHNNLFNAPAFEVNNNSAPYRSAKFWTPDIASNGEWISPFKMTGPFNTRWPFD